MNIYRSSSLATFLQTELTTMVIWERERPNIKPKKDVTDLQ